jgi:TatD DNase family protein
VFRKKAGSLADTTMHYIDIHTHINLSAFREDEDATIARAHEARMGLVNVGTMHKTSAHAIDIAQRYESGVWATVGLHPVHTSPSFHDTDEIGEEGKAFTSKGEVFAYDFYKTLAQHEKVVAIGECGLDYYRDITKEEKKKQFDAFAQQIALANEVGKPLMLHLRSGTGGNAYKDAHAILKQQARVRGNAHFFAGSIEDAKLFWDMGYSTSFTGVLTFTHDYDDVVRAAPHGLIHAETDAPYVAPAPHRGRRNEPVYVVEVVKKQAELRGVDVDVWAAQLRENAKEMFGVRL